MMWRFAKLLAALASVVTVVACDHHRPKPPMASVAVAAEVCETNALAEEHRTLTNRIGSIESGAPTEYHDESWTILLQKLNNYRAEIDATFRFVTANCKAYNLCMQVHRYNEMECGNSRFEWSRSHEKFNQLALDLAKLEAPKNKPQQPIHCQGSNCGHPCGSNCNNPPPACSPCNIQGSVFSTGCSSNYCKDHD